MLPIEIDCQSLKRDTGRSGSLYLDIQLLYPIRVYGMPVYTEAIQYTEYQLKIIFTPINFFIS